MVQFITGSWEQDPNDPDQQRRWRQAVDNVGNFVKGSYWEYRPKKSSKVVTSPHETKFEGKFNVCTIHGKAFYTYDRSDHETAHLEPHHYESWGFSYDYDGHLEIYKGSNLYYQDDLGSDYGRQRLMQHIQYWVDEGKPRDPFPWVPDDPPKSPPPLARPDLYALAKRLYDGTLVYDKAIQGLSPWEIEQLSMIYDAEYITKETQDMSKQLSFIIQEQKRQRDFAQAMMSRIESNFEIERGWTIKVGNELKDMGLSLQSIGSMNPRAVEQALNQAVKNIEWDEDIAWRVENRLIPYFQTLDDYGLIRSVAFMLGGIAGSLMEKPIREAFGKAVEKEVHNIPSFHSRARRMAKGVPEIEYQHTALSDAMAWGSRWFTGIPLYELTKKAIYSQPDYEVTQGRTVETWNAFLDLQKRCQRRGIINGRWSVKLSRRLPYNEWVNRMYTSLKTYANQRGVY